ncbi:hypothetical protein [Spongiibacter marinus]|uniref:hypothetical protein n=1 Tax=Spongiibacter marinus TaxID=354246 RepID=UPI00196010FD|nr:hypothetical protein [Spongiibacter marinus]MBM7424959.1 hypothetical protein [Spongiibacter marinus]
MIYRLERLLEEWARCCRLNGADLAGLGYPKGMGAVVMEKRSTGRKKATHGLGKTAHVLRASIGGGLDARATASRPSKAPTRHMRGDVERLDKAIAALPGDEQYLLEVAFVREGLNKAQRAGLLGVCVQTMDARLDALGLRLDREIFGESYVNADLADISAQLDGLNDKLSTV